jgi:hypothetical protein
MAGAVRCDGQALFDLANTGNDDGMRRALEALIEVERRAAGEEGEAVSSDPWLFRQGPTEYGLAHAAVVGGSTEVMEMLIEHGGERFDLKMLNSNRRTAAMIAAYQGKHALLAIICRRFCELGEEEEMLVVGQRDSVAGNAVETNSTECLEVLAKELPPHVALKLLTGTGLSDKPDATPLEKAKNTASTQDRITELIEDLKVQGIRTKSAAKRA